MYLERLRLQNVKLLADQEFDFLRADGSLRHWTVLLGENGLCKTAILQCIAIATSGEKLARALISDAQDFVDVRRGERGALIEASLRGLEAPSRASWEIVMTVPVNGHAFIGHGDVSVLDQLRDMRRPGLFVAGYGVGRRIPRRGEVPTPRDPARNRLESLFDAQQLLLGIDFFEVLKEKGLHREYARVLRDVLLRTDAEGNGLLPWLASVELRGRGGVGTMEQLLESRRMAIDIGGEIVKLAPHQLSQGYQSMFGWIADLLGHAFLDAGAPVDPQVLEGIVLLDEIDLHLHPTWQRRIVPILRATFPKLQFIVTTHSPLVLTGFEADEIVRLGMRDGQVVQEPVQREPGMQSGTELMESFFSVSTAARPDLVEKQGRYAELLARGNACSPQEREECTELGSELEPYLQSTEFSDLLPPDEIPAGDLGSPELQAWRQTMRSLRSHPRADRDEGALGMSS
ncbi:MAG: AAA family ATPase [Planctomycetes bacterium]|nr:AAA family ATPase [Planctomycetota bacterium]